MGQKRNAKHSGCVCDVTASSLQALHSRQASSPGQSTMCPGSDKVTLNIIAIGLDWQQEGVISGQSILTRALAEAGLAGKHGHTALSTASKWLRCRSRSDLPWHQTGSPMYPRHHTVQRSAQAWP